MVTVSCCLQLKLGYDAQQYRGHEHSRESIELAYDRILQEKMNVRHKHGFKPVRTGRKTDVQGDAEVSYQGQYPGEKDFLMCVQPHCKSA